MTRAIVRPARSQLNASSLKELALAYVGKYATTRAKLRAYLMRKVRERGWSDQTAPQIEELAQRFAELGYVDDAAYALAKARSLSARGYGKRRLFEKLSGDGVEDKDRTAADAYADDASIGAALHFAKRRRLGPFAKAAADPRQREKWVAAMVRAGHEYGTARAIASMSPDPQIDLQTLEEQLASAKR